MRPAPRPVCDNPAMARLAQIQISFAPVEDRLLMRLNTDDGAEFRFWLTRRYVRILWPILHQLALPDTPASGATSPAAQAAVANFQREQALDQADFESAFESTAKALPLGADPVLLTRAQSKRSADGLPVLCLHPADGAGIDIALEPQVSHSLLALLENAVEAADWQLQNPAPGNTTTPRPPAERLN